MATNTIPHITPPGFLKVNKVDKVGNSLGSPSSNSEQKLVDDIFWNVGRNFLDDSRDIFALARTNRMLWRQLEYEVYRADILTAKKYSKEAEGTITSNEERMVEAFAAYSDPNARTGGAFPDETRWLHADGVNYKSLASPTKRLPPPSKLTALQWAAITGNIKTARRVIRVAGRVWPGYIDFENPLNLQKAVHLAAMYGQTEIARLLENSGCNINGVSGYMCLARRSLREVLHHINPRLGHIPIGYDLDNFSRSFVLNALGFAILRGHEATADYLAEFYDDSQTGDLLPDRVYNINTTEFKFEYIMPPLHLAAFMGMTKIVKKLLEKGANVNTICSQIQSSTSLMWAVACKENKETVDMLIEAGVSLTAEDAKGRSALDWALNWFAPVHALRLVAAGLPIDQWGFDWTGSCELSFCMGDDTFLEVTQLILEKHTDLSPDFLQECMHDVLEVTGIRNTRTMRWLIKHDIGLGTLHNTNAKTYNEPPKIGRSVLHHAAASSMHVDLFELLLNQQHDLDINQKTHQGETLLSLAAEHHDACTSELVGFLLQKGADIEAVATHANREVLRARKEGKPLEYLRALAKTFRKKRKAGARAQEALARKKRRLEYLAAHPEITKEEAQFILDQDIRPNVVVELCGYRNCTATEVFALWEKGVDLLQELFREVNEAYLAARRAEAIDNSDEIHPKRPEAPAWRGVKGRWWGEQEDMEEEETEEEETEEEECPQDTSDED
ncbi:putative ankyrin repeat domain protein [Seiridium cardinale]